LKLLQDASVDLFWTGVSTDPSLQWLHAEPGGRGPAICNSFRPAIGLTIGEKPFPRNGNNAMRRVLWLACFVLSAASSLSAQEPKLRSTLNGHTESAMSVAYSPDRKTLASGRDDKAIKLWDARNGRNIATIINADARCVRCVAYSPDGKTLASAGWDGTIKLWNIATQKSIAILNANKDRIHSLAFSPDGKILASGNIDVGTIKLWDLDKKPDK
jgi:WD40 repeat protein